MRDVSRSIDQQFAICPTAADALQELERRERVYRGERLPPDVRGRVVILVDDGCAGAVAMRAAVTALRQQQASQIIVSRHSGTEPLRPR